jgi:hypothetical protein
MPMALGVVCIYMWSILLQQPFGRKVCIHHPEHAALTGPRIVY